MMTEVRIPWTSSECMGRNEGLGEGGFYTAFNNVITLYRWHLHWCAHFIKIPHPTFLICVLFCMYIKL